ncbi:MAG: MBL fold metallo-hydrolase [Clostridia bacterium]|nr:MBL fold metallo-hydrolase [Clostridia bacterium]
MSKIKIKWLGHSCFRVEKDGYSFVLDPFEPGSVPGLNDVNEEANAVYCSHGHHDHGYRDAVKIVEGPASPFTVTEIHTFHDEVQGAKRGQNIIHVFESEGVKLVHFGDLGCDLTPEQVEILRGADCILIPVGGFFTIDANQAKAIAEQIEAKVVVPMHYRTSDFGYDVIAHLDDYLNICGRYVRTLTDTIEIGNEERHYTAVLSYGK